MFHVKHRPKTVVFDPFPNLRYKLASEAKMQARFDVVVIGGGQPAGRPGGCRARTGRRAHCACDPPFATVGAMTCNPAIGGLGKGHFVSESMR